MSCREAGCSPRSPLTERAVVRSRLRPTACLGGAGTAMGAASVIQRRQATNRSRSPPHVRRGRVKSRRDTALRRADHRAAGTVAQVPVRTGHRGKLRLDWARGAESGSVAVAPQRAPRAGLPRSKRWASTDRPGRCTQRVTLPIRHSSQSPSANTSLLVINPVRQPGRRRSPRCGKVPRPEEVLGACLSGLVQLSKRFQKLQPHVRGSRSRSHSVPSAYEAGEGAVGGDPL